MDKAEEKKPVATANEVKDPTKALSKQEMETAYLQGIDVFDPDIEDIFKRYPEIKNEVLGGLRNREVRLQLAEKQYKEALSEHQTELKIIENLLASRDPDLQRKGKELMIANDKSSETLLSLKKQKDDILNYQDLKDQVKGAMPKGLVQLPGNVQISEGDFNRMMEDSDFFQKQADSLIRRGHSDAVDELASMIGQKLVPQQSQPMEAFEKQTVDTPAIQPIERKETIGAGNPDENIKKNIGMMMGGVVGTSADKAVGAVKTISNSLRSQRAKG